MRLELVMSTKDRILKGALALFNAEGYGQASALDIATALAISPGHLYYHFKGKPEIALSLLVLHEAEMVMILAACEQDVAAASNPRTTLQTFLHIQLEEMEDYRFLYREFASLARTNNAIVAGLTRLAKRQRECLTRCLEGLTAPGTGNLAAEAIQLGLWAMPGQMELLGGELDPKTRASASAARLIALLDIMAGPAPAPPSQRKGRKRKG
jgi:AcrR family transcriptional regulator